MRSVFNIYPFLCVLAFACMCNTLTAQAVTLSFSNTNPTCFGYTNGIATVIPSGGSGNYAYRWDNGQAGASNLGLTAGIYYVTVTDLNSGWVSTGSTVLTQPNQLVVTLNPINANCGGFDGNITTQVTGGSGIYTYNWSNGATTSSLSGLGNGGGGYFLTVTDSNGCGDVDFIHVYPAPQMVANAQVQNPSCTGQSNGAIQNLYVYGNYGPFTYVWPNGAANTNLTGLAAGTYTVTLSDANGCTLTQTYTLTSQSNLDIAIDVVSNKCNGQSLGSARTNIISGAPPFQFNWSTGAQTQNISGLSAGNYTVTVSDASGCTGTLVASVTAPDKLGIVLLEEKGTCGNANNGSLLVKGVGGVEPFKYAWSQGGTTPAISNLAVGNYTCTITDANFCFTSSEFKVNSLSPITATIVVSSANCTGVPNGTATVIAQGGTQPYSYQWNVQSVNAATINGLAGGTNVVVTVTDALGCSATATGYISIHQSVLVGVTNTNVLCSYNLNGTATAVASNGAAPYTYTWNVPGLGQVSGPTISNLGVGSYAVTATDANGCTGVSVANITATDPVKANYSLNVVGCHPNPTVTLSDASTSAVSWLWNIYGPTGVVTFNTQNPGTLNLPSGSNGTVQLQVQSAQGCVANISNPFLIQGEVLNVALSNSAISACVNTPQTISVVNSTPNNPVTVSWFSSPSGLTISNPNTAQTSFSGPAGNYVLNAIVSGTQGCVDTLSAAVTISNDQTLATFKPDLCEGLRVSFDNPNTVAGTWSFGDGATSTQNDPVHTYNTAGTYIVTFTPAVACVDPIKDTIQVSATKAVDAGFQQVLVSCDSVAVFRFQNTSIPSTGLTFNWSFGQGLPNSTLPNPTVSYPNIGPATIVLTATDANGCKDTANVTVSFNIITETIAPDQSYCIGTNAVSLNPGTPNSNYTYVWTSNPTDPTLMTNVPNPSVRPTVPTTYTLSITWGGCNLTKNVTITPNAAAQLTSPADINSCETGNVVVNASSTNGTIRWSTSPTFTNPVAGPTYTITQPVTITNLYVQATTPQGCVTTDTIAVSLQPVNITLVPSPTANVCAGASKELKVTNNDPNDQLTYSWSGGLPASATQNVSPTAITSYTVTVTNQFNCTTTASVQLTPVSLSVTINNMSKDTLCPGDEAELMAVPGVGGTYTYQWSPSSLIVGSTTEALANVKPTSAQTFTVTITDANGCTATSSYGLAWRELACARPYVFLPSAFTPNADTQNDRIMVRGIHIEELYFVIYDRWGEQVFQTDIVSDLGWDGTFKSRTLSPDSYGYYFNVRCTGGTRYEEKGNITLLR